MSVLSYPFDNAYILQKKKSIKKELLQKEKFIDKKIAILSGSTIGEIKNILELFLLDYDIKPEFLIGGYNRYFEELMFDDGTLKNFAPDYIYIHTSIKNIKDLPTPEDTDEDVKQKLENEFNRYRAVCEKALSFGAVVIVNNFEMPFYRMFGSKDAVVPQGVVNFVTKLNIKIRDYIAGKQNLYLNDINYLSGLIGLDNWFSLENWYLYKYACAVDKIPDLAFSIAKIIKSTLGKNKKSVILDLDNTLWGGIIGDDGVEGIAIGNEQPAGMSYTEFQNYLKNLRSLGIVLNVSSKNEEDIAKQGFTKRTEAPLNYEDFLYFKANWNPKSVNISSIIKDMNIGEDAFVFIDDNPAEREIVKQQLPKIRVPDVKSPEEYIKAIDRAGYFEITTFTDDDKKRNEQYKTRAKARAAMAEFTDYASYLKSLEMTGEIGSFSMAHIERITQLINKSNQFNFTTRRYTTSEVEEVINNKDKYISCYAKLIDKFGDNGITTCMIASVNGDVANIDLWVMSCRVLKRDLELRVFDYLVEQCKKRGIKTIEAAYLPTAKNALVKNQYEEIGLKCVLDSLEKKLYTFDVTRNYENKNKVIDMKEV